MILPNSSLFIRMTVSNRKRSNRPNKVEINTWKVHSKNQTLVLANNLVTVVACSYTTIHPMLNQRMQYS